MIEIRAITEFPGYGVSADGKVWRITQPSDGPGAKRKVPYELSPGSNPSGYKIAILVKGGKTFGRSVHRLVLAAFAGPCPTSFQGAHNDGNKTHNDITNLRWASASDNQTDRVKHGTHTRGQCNSRSILSNTDIPFIQSYPKFHGVSAFLARAYGVSHTAICAIRNGKTWRNL
jgi:hypothetical protein